MLKVVFSKISTQLLMRPIDPYPFSEPSSNIGPIGFDQLIIVCWGIQSSEYIFCSIQHYTKILVPKAQLTTVG